MNLFNTKQYINSTALTPENKPLDQISLQQINDHLNSDMAKPLDIHNTELKKAIEESHLDFNKMPRKFISETGDGVKLYELEEPTSITWNNRLILAKFIAPVSGSYGIEVNYTPADYQPAVYVMKPAASQSDDTTAYTYDTSSLIINAVPLVGYVYAQQLSHTAESGTQQLCYPSYSIYPIPVTKGGTTGKQYFYAKQGEAVAITAGGATNVGTNNVIIGRTVTLTKVEITYQQQ